METTTKPMVLKMERGFRSMNNENNTQITVRNGGYKYK
jgi:hypothetical protein